MIFGLAIAGVIACDIERTGCLVRMKVVLLVAGFEAARESERIEHSSDEVADRDTEGPHILRVASRGFLQASGWHKGDQFDDSRSSWSTGRFGWMQFFGLKHGGVARAIT